MQRPSPHKRIVLRNYSAEHCRIIMPGQSQSAAYDLPAFGDGLGFCPGFHRFARNAFGAPRGPACLAFVLDLFDRPQPDTVAALVFISPGHGYNAYWVPGIRVHGMEGGPEATRSALDFPQSGIAARAMRISWLEWHPYTGPSFVRGRVRQSFARRFPRHVTQ